MNNRSEIVWKELIKLRKHEEWVFGQYENQKYIVTTFNLEDKKRQNFRNNVTENNLEFHSFILEEFDEDITNDILVLASHFNGLLSFCSVKVSVKYNYVEFVYTGDLITYKLFLVEIHSD